MGAISGRRVGTFVARPVERKRTVLAAEGVKGSRRRVLRVGRWRDRRTGTGRVVGRATRRDTSWFGSQITRVLEQVPTSLSTFLSPRICSGAFSNQENRSTTATVYATTTDPKISSSGRDHSRRVFERATRSNGPARSCSAMTLRALAHLQQCSRRDAVVGPEHSWRWRESNPRLSSSLWDFSERSRCFDLGFPSPSGRLRVPQPRSMSPPTPRPCRRVSCSL